MHRATRKVSSLKVGLQEEGWGLAEVTPARSQLVLLRRQRNYLLSSGVTAQDEPQCRNTGGHHR